MAIETLLPKKLNITDDSYKSFLDLNEALSSAEQEHIRNIALTGPFGSRFFELIISIISEEEQKLLFKKEFVSKFLTKNKNIIDTATFTIDCPNYLVQLSADKETHIPLPIMCITEKN